MQADIATGLKIEWLTTIYAAQIRDITLPEHTRADVDVSHQETPDDELEFDPADLADAGALEYEIHFDKDTSPPINQPKEQVKVTFPLVLLATPGTWQWAGYVNRFAPSLPFNQKMVATIGAKVSGKITKVAES